ncbi:copper resistance CopC/CopD family protein [Microvirga soli]|uniref:copper resistance CopC/CopD family protein n=1 Tax=Microvirga soli TaxID=1854496 RepID=UPI00191F4DF0|nr:CopD family protein [Microvirga soli]
MMRAIIITLWLALAGLWGSDAALAHAALVETHPADGAVVEDGPAAVRLRFNEPVSPLVIGLTDARGRSHPGLRTIARNELLEIFLPPDLPRGTHVLSYRVNSGDGHPIGGAVVFSIGAPTEAGNRSGETGTGEGAGTVLWLARVTLYLGLFAGVGGAFFRAWLAHGLPGVAVDRVLHASIAVGIVASAASLGLQGIDALGGTLADMAAPAAWAAGWGTSYGQTTAAGTAALILGWLSMHGPDGWRRAGSVSGMGAVGLSFALSGHASAADPQWLTRPAVFVHAVGIAYWIGALIPLAIIIRKAPGAAFPVVRRFSTGALVTVAAITLAGIALAVIQVESTANLIGTAYGQVLVAKTLLAGALLGLAALNRRWLTPAMTAPEGSGAKWLVRSVKAEIVLCLAILALVGLWRFTPPPRALASSAEASRPASVHLHSNRLMAQVTMSPGRVGPTRARIVVATGQAEPIDAKEVTLRLARPDAGIEPIVRKARKVGSCAWEVDSLVLPLAGAWKATVDVLVDDFEKVSLGGSLTVKP